MQVLIKLLLLQYYTPTTHYKHFYNRVYETHTKYTVYFCRESVFVVRKRRRINGGIYTTTNSTPTNICRSKTENIQNEGYVILNDTHRGRTERYRCPMYRPIIQDTS